MKRILRSLNRTLAIAEKEWIHIRRDTRSMVLSLLLPMFMILLFGYALTMDVKHVGIAILDQDKSAFSRGFIESFAHTEYLDIYAYVRNTKEIDKLINQGKVILGLVIPPEFEKRHKSGKTASVQLLVDGSDSTSATVALGYIRSILFEYNQKNRLSELNAIGISRINPPVDIRNRIWYNAELQSKNFIVPGIMVIIMSIISAMITSLTISREWERGTMETLITTPVRKFEIFFGKLFTYMLISLFDVILTICTGYFVFGVPIRGSFFELYLVALLFLIGTSSLGILISSATRSQVLSVQVAIIATYLPSIILSGYIFPVKNMPALVQLITYIIPAKYLIVYMKGVSLKGVGYSVLWVQIIFLFFYALIVSLISLKKMSLKLPEN